LPLTYQWRRNGVNVGSPSTSPTYTKVNCSTADSGNYDVIVRNPFGGSVTSSAVSVNVDPTVIASIGTQPQSAVIYSNYDASFSAVAAGTPPFTYQWKHAGTNLPGATSSTLTLTQGAASQLGSYTVAVTNILGGAVSGPATLSFITPASLYEGTVTGKRPWAYWRLNDGSGTTATNIGLVSVVDNVVGAAAGASYRALQK
jgi:beta-galactosidase